MADDRIRDIVIVGGGTAGWMTAAALARMAGTQRHAITLVESDEIGSIGVGEATIPAMLLFNELLGIDEDEFVRQTQATFKLGIEFVDWRRLGHSYFHHFGSFGADLRQGIPFSHLWLRWLKEGGNPDNLRFSAEAQAAALGRFARVKSARPGSPSIHYAFQFDAALYAAYLRRYAEKRGVMRSEGRVAGVHRNGLNGFIESVELADGRRIPGDLFVDCSGFRALLIEGALEAGYEGWSRWLPSNRALAVPSERIGDPVPFTRAIARDAGWQWQIPLQHRSGNGYVFCDAFATEERATETLMGQIPGAPLADARLLRFTAGKRRRSWIGNCVAVGLSGGFLEPLESTSIYLIQSAIVKLLGYFPDRNCDPLVAARFNAQIDQLYDSVRDFLIAHYKVTERDDTPFWRHCRAMSVPDTLRERLELFGRRGEVLVGPNEPFRETNWFAILYGQGLVPDGYHPLADTMSADDLALFLSQIRRAIAERVESLPPHQAYLDRIAAAGA